MVHIPPQIYTVVRKIQKKGFRLYLVGGAVRTQLLGGIPADFDFASDALPEQILEIFPYAIPTGIAHGTVTVPRKPYTVEITTLRREGAYRDGRHPEQVSFTNSIYEDLSRRDFTINAIAFDLQKKEIIDPYGGSEDIAKSIIRAVGDPRERFQEDRLRILRAVRFATELQCSIDPPTKEAIPPCASDINRLSSERIHAELNKILQSKFYRRGILLLHELSLLQAIFGVLSDEMHRSLLHPAFDSLGLSKPVTRLASCFLTSYHSETIGAQVPAMLRSLTFPQKIIKGTDRLCRALTRPIQASTKAATLRKYLSQSGRDLIEDELELRRAYGLSTAVLNRMKKEGKNPLCLAELSINGRDLGAVFDVKGPQLGKLLNYLLERVLARPSCNTKAQLIEIADHWIKAPDRSDFTIH